MTDTLRVALLTGSLARSGAEKQFVYAASALQGRDVDVRIYSLTQGEYYERVLTEMGLPPVYLGAGRVQRLRAFLGETRRFQPHIIQTGQLFAGFYAGFIGRLLGITSVGNMRSSQVSMMALLGRTGFYLSLRLTPNLIANSYNAAGELKDSGSFNPKHMYVLENVIDLKDFDARLHQPVDPPLETTAAVKLLMVARLVPQKRIDRFLTALAQVRTHVPDVVGLIAGNGPEEDHLKQQAAALGLLPDGVQFLGLRGDVPALLKQADMMVLTSNYEGFPNVIIEAMAAGCPVVTTPAGDSGVVIVDGETGFCVPFDDAEALADRLLQLVRSPELRQQFGAAGRARVETKYSYDMLADPLLGIYAEIARKRKNTALLRVLAQHTN